MAGWNSGSHSLDKCLNRLAGTARKFPANQLLLEFKDKQYVAKQEKQCFKHYFLTLLASSLESK